MGKFRRALGTLAAAGFAALIGLLVWMMFLVGTGHGGDQAPAVVAPVFALSFFAVLIGGGGWAVITWFEL